MPSAELGVTRRPPIEFPSRIGVWWASDHQPISAAQEIAREIESLGYGSLFFAEAGAKEAFSQASALLHATDRLVVGTGIANIHARIPAAAEAGARTIHAQFPKRFVLGLGVSHAPLVESQLGGTYGRPLKTMREYLQQMDALSVNVEPGVERPPRVLAALGPKMIDLGRSHADGVHPTFVLPEHTVNTRLSLGPEKWLITNQGVSLAGTAADRLRWAREHLGYYSTLPNYRNSWIRQGFEESDLVDGGSERLLRAMVIQDSVESAAVALHSHLNAGANHVLIQIFEEEPFGYGDPRPTLRKLAAVLGMART